MAENSKMRTTMNGKPVKTLPARTIINFKSGFAKKLLCDGMTFSTGTACTFSCAFCYVPAAMLKSTGMTEAEHMQTVIRRENALEVLRKQLRDSKGIPKFKNDGPKVIYASPLVDVAGNMELVRETIEACKIILADTSWHIRLLSKSNLLIKVAIELEGWCASDDARERIIYGVSTGTLYDDLALAFEQGTAKPSKRIQCLHDLQDAGYRTFGMICPSLPQKSYQEFASACASALRIEKCEHVWAEVMNVRGDSFVRTYKSLHAAGYIWEANEVVSLAENKERWEQYARDTFSGYALDDRYRGKLRFLQYVNKDTRAFWESQRENGAVIL